MGRRALNGMFPATLSGESLDPRTLALKGSPESSNPSLLLADGETEAQRWSHHCRDQDTYWGNSGSVSSPQIPGSTVLLGLAIHDGTPLVSKPPSGPVSTLCLGNPCFPNL